MSVPNLPDLQRHARAFRSRHPGFSIGVPVLIALAALVFFGAKAMLLIAVLAIPFVALLDKARGTEAIRRFLIDALSNKSTTLEPIGAVQQPPYSLTERSVEPPPQVPRAAPARR
jgi:hypothetical protein